MQKQAKREADRAAKQAGKQRKLTDKASNNASCAQSNIEQPPEKFVVEPATPEAAAPVNQVFSRLGRIVKRPAYLDD